MKIMKKRKNNLYLMKYLLIFSNSQCNKRPKIFRHKNNIMNQKANRHKNNLNKLLLFLVYQHKVLLKLILIRQIWKKIHKILKMSIYHNKL